MMVQPIRNETAAEIAEVLFTGWTAIFGPTDTIVVLPSRLLSNGGKDMSVVLRRLCENIGTKKVFMTRYSLQTDGMMERFNATFCWDLAKFTTYESEWDKHVSSAVYRYNCSIHDATGVTQFGALCGVEAFEFDALIGL